MSRPASENPARNPVTTYLTDAELHAMDFLREKSNMKRSEYVRKLVVRNGEKYQKTNTIPAAPKKSTAKSVKFTKDANAKTAVLSPSKKLGATKVSLKGRKAGKRQGNATANDSRD